MFMKLATFFDRLNTKKKIEYHFLYVKLLFMKNLIDRDGSYDAAADEFFKSIK